MIAWPAASRQALCRRYAAFAFGHVSVRHRKLPDRFLLAHNMAPGSVTASDILEFHIDGSPVNRQGPRPYLERFIHGEISCTTIRTRSSRFPFRHNIGCAQSYIWPVSLVPRSPTFRNP
jgi:hypothetical protein